MLVRYLIRACLIIAVILSVHVLIEHIVPKELCQITKINNRHCYERKTKLYMEQHMIVNGNQKAFFFAAKF